MMRDNNSPKILVIAPVFEERLFDGISSSCDISYYEEKALIKSSKFWRIGQAICYLIDIILPRSLAFSGRFRKLRVNTPVAENLYREFNKKCGLYDKVFLIKAFGARRQYFSKSNQRKLNLILWDSIARYDIFKDMSEHLVATTSYYDSKKLNVPVMIFNKNKKIIETYSDNNITKPKVFVGRFSVVRLCKSLALSLKVKDFKSYMGFSPINSNFLGIKMSKSHVTVDQIEMNEVLITDLNEDSPSIRVDNENVSLVISDLLHLKNIFPNKNIYTISYRTGVISPAINTKSIRFLTLSQLIR